MVLQTLSDVERSIGGRPKQDASMVRITFYLPEVDAIRLKDRARSQHQPVSTLLRDLVRTLLNTKPTPY